MSLLPEIIKTFHSNILDSSVQSALFNQQAAPKCEQNRARDIQSAEQAGNTKWFTGSLFSSKAQMHRPPELRSEHKKQWFTSSAQALHQANNSHQWEPGMFHNLENGKFIKKPADDDANMLHAGKEITLVQAQQ